MRAYVSATGPGGTASAVSSGAGPVAMAPPINTGAPAVIGAAQVGADAHRRASAAGTRRPRRSPTRGSARYGSGGFQAIPGATRSAYTVSPNDLGDTIRVIVTATNPDGTRGRHEPAHGHDRSGACRSRSPRQPRLGAHPGAPAPQATAPSAKSLPALPGGRTVSAPS